MIERRADLEKTALDRSLSHVQRFRAVQALGGMKDPRSEKTLLLALKDEYPIVRHAAISALAELGGMEAEAALEGLLCCKKVRVRCEAARALIKISGVPESQPGNLERLFNLLSSGDECIESAILKMGNPALDFLKERLDDAPLIERQHAARILARHIRSTLDRLLPGEEPFAWLADHNIAPKAISDLYRCDTIRNGESVDKVTNTGFDGISRALCGCEKIIFPQKIIAINHSGYHEKRVDFNGLLAKYNAGEPKRMGMTIIAPAKEGFLALKLILSRGDETKLFIESRLQSCLRELSLESTLPRPLEGLFRIDGLPLHLLEDLELKKPLAIGYIADRGYFTYLNDPQLSINELERGLNICARDLAALTGCGLIHTSLIPLFHKKRKSPQEGAGYCWQRKTAGRLESWLESCRYPNLRLSGIADFEHIEILGDVSPDRLQHHIGDHLLSMSLTVASYFRIRGNFCRKAMRSIIRDCFGEYLRVFSRSPPVLDEIIDWDALAARMVEEMGLDRCGCKPDADGMHLGRPHGPFPIPELIRAIHIISAFSVMQIWAGLAALPHQCGQGRGRKDCIPQPVQSRNIS